MSEEQKAYDYLEEWKKLREKVKEFHKTHSITLACEIADKVFEMEIHNEG